MHPVSANCVKNITMLGVSLRATKSNIETRKRTKIVHVIEGAAKMKWSWTGNIASLED